MVSFEFVVPKLLGQDPGWHHFLLQGLLGSTRQEEAPNSAGGNESLCKLHALFNELLTTSQEAKGSPQ